MQHRRYSSISVKNICQTALVHRATFYKHYHSRAELLKDWLDYVIIPWQNCNLEQVIRQPFTPFPATCYDTFHRIFLRQRYDAIFLSELNKYFQNYYYQIFRQHQLRVRVSYSLLAKIYNDEVTDIYLDWLDNHPRKQEDIEQMNQVFRRISRVPDFF